MKKTLLFLFLSIFTAPALPINTQQTAPTSIKSDQPSFAQNLLENIASGRFLHDKKTIKILSAATVGTSLYLHHKKKNILLSTTLHLLGISLALRALTQNNEQFEQRWYRFYEVCPNRFYRAAQMPPEILKNQINKYGIKTVINLCGTFTDDISSSKQERIVVESCGAHYIEIAMDAHHLTKKENLLKLLDSYATTQTPILVHCRAGVDRTGEATAIYLLDQMNTNKEKALSELSYFKYGHWSLVHPAKQLLIKIWQGREWAQEEYDEKIYRQLKS